VAGLTDDEAPSVCFNVRAEESRDAESRCNPSLKMERAGPRRKLHLLYECRNVAPQASHQRTAFGGSEVRTLIFAPTTD